MIKKCVGCGAVFQSLDPKKEGYVELENYDRSLVCKRCFRIKNYGDYQIISKNFSDYQTIFDDIKVKNGLVLFLCDILTIDDTLEKLNHFKGKVILVITKKDLLPKSVKEQKLLSYINKNYDLNVVSMLFVSSVKNYNLDNLMSLIMKHKVGNEVYLVGNTNAGKSTLINALIKSYSSQTASITTSVLPATTLDVIKIKVNEDLTLVDTPGLINENNYLTNASFLDVKKLSPKVEIKPKTYQMKPNQSLIIGEKYARIDYLGPDNNSFTLYLSNDVKVTRINLNTNDSLRNLPKYEFTLKDAKDVVISGLCFCKITKKAKINIYVKDGVKVYKRDNLI